MRPINQPSAALRAWTVDLGDGRPQSLAVILDQARHRRGNDIADVVRHAGRTLARMTRAALETYVGAEQYRPYLR